MRLTLCFLLLLGFYFLLSNGENPKQFESQRVSSTNRPSIPRRSLNRVRNARRQQRIKRASKVVCSYALNGKWPPYPKRLRQMVSIQSSRILRMSKEDQKSYCGKLNNSSTTRRPTRRPQFTTTRFTTRRPPFYQFTTQKIYPQTQFPTVSTPKFTYFTIPFIFTTSRPSTIPSTTILSTPSTTTFSTITPSTVSTTLSSSTLSSLNRGIILPIIPISTTTNQPLTTVSTTTTTTQKAPTGSASSYYYSGSGSAYYSGSGSAYYSSTGSLTANTEDQSSRLTRKSNDVATRSFKAKNGDIIIKWTPGGGKLKKISDK